MQGPRLSPASVSPLCAREGAPSISPDTARTQRRVRKRKQEEMSKGLAGPLYIQSLSGSPWRCARWRSWALGTSLNCAAQLQQGCTPSPPARLPSHTVPPAGAAKAQAGLTLSLNWCPCPQAPTAPPGAGRTEHRVSTGNVLRANNVSPGSGPPSCRPAPLGCQSHPSLHSHEDCRAESALRGCCPLCPPAPQPVCLEENPEAPKVERPGLSVGLFRLFSCCLCRSSPASPSGSHSGCCLDKGS